MLRAALRALPLHCPVRVRVGCTPALVRLASTGMNAHGVYDPNAEEEWTPRQDQATRMAAMSKAIDLRSDTVTRPTAEMTIAMIDADVGDDVYGEDKTVNRLQSLAAETLGKEAALFVPSGTMANLISIGAHCQRGDELIVGDESHMVHYEQGGVSQFLGVTMHTLPNREDGTIALQSGRGSLAAALQARGGGLDAHCARPAVFALENTHNRCGGAVLPLAFIRDAAQMAHDAGLVMHMDGARLMNAAAASGASPATIAEHMDSVTLCLSKGLGAPVGSVIAGSKHFIARCHRLRKALGGGMRQAGVIASAGIVGIREQAKLLASDHAKAKSLARGLAGIPGVRLDARRVATNIVYFELDAKHLSAANFWARVAADVVAETGAAAAAAAEADLPAEVTVLRACALEANRDADTATLFCRIIEEAADVRMSPFSDTRVRAVTHHQIRDADVDVALDAAALAAQLLSAP